MAHGKPVLKLVAVGTDGRHALGIRFADLAPGVVYRASAWVKTRPGVQIMIEVRDAVEQASAVLPATASPNSILLRKLL